MNSHNDAVATSSPAFDIASDPWTQAIVAGLVTLIPARKYPGWLRQGFIWAPTVVAVAGSGYVLAKQSAQPQKAGAAVAGLMGGGAAVSLASAFSLWADEKLERGLGRLKIPFPRAVMAAAAGAVTWWQVKQEHQRDH